jgi:hypothetical protein
MMRNDKLKSLFLPVRSGLFHQQFNLLHILPCSELEQIHATKEQKEEMERLLRKNKK